MPGFSFIHAGFLAAGLAATVPVLIHLLFRQKARQLPIGSLRFLQQVVREHQRRRRVRQWILLALRVLAVLLLVLLFARPFLPKLGSGGQDEEVVVLVDRSASMQVREGRSPTALERAREEVRHEIKRFSENTAVHLAWCDAGGVEEISLDQFFAAPTAGSWLATDYGLALGWAQDVLAKGGRSRRRILLFTDLQHGGVDRSSIPTLEPGTTLDLRDVGSVVVQDLAVTQADVTRTEIRPGEPIKARAVLRNGGALPVRGVVVEVRLKGPAGAVRAAKPVDLAGGQTATVEIPLAINQAGIYRGVVAIESDDALAWDNERHLAFEARPPDRVLLVDGQEGRSVFQNETYFLETALRLRSNDSAERVGAFEVERIVWDAGQGFPNLQGFRAVVLANVRRLTPEDVRRLVDFAEAGGSVLMFAGDQTNATQLEALRESELLGGEPVAVAVEGRFRATKWEVEHPALEIFQDPQRGDLRRLEFQKLLPLRQVSETGGKVLLEAGGHAALVERIVGKGRFLYLGWTADREWSDWPRTRLFVPLVRQLLAYATGALAQRAIVVQETAIRSEQEPGIREQEGRIVVCNVDPQEAILDRVTSDELAEAAGTQDAAGASEEETQRAAMAAAPNAERPEEIWTYILWGLFCILAAELLLAGQVHQ